jgi:PAS domain S-box-containing protein
MASSLVQLLTGLLIALIGMLLYGVRRQALRLREAERSLAESQDHFRLVFEHSGVGMALLSPEGHFLQANPAMVRLFGYDAAQLVGKRLIDLVHADEVQVRTNQTELGLKVPADMYERERRYRRADGQELWARVLRVPLRDAAGQLRYIVAVMIDITERRRAQEELATSEQRLRQERDFIAQVLESADALILVLDGSGRILRYNGKCAAVSGKREPEMQQQVFWEILIPEPFRESVKARFAEARDAEIALSLESPLVSATGEQRVISWRFTMAQDGQGRPRWVIAAGLDITDQKRLEEQLRHAQKMEVLGTLVGGIAHDFNNQLTIVLGNIRLLQAELISHSRGCAELVDAEQAAQRCADMTQGLLTFSRRRMAQVSAVDLNHLLAESARLLRRVLPATIAIDTTADPELWPVLADRTQLHQLLMNLAVNARDAMPAGGVLTLSTFNHVVDESVCTGHVEWRPGNFVVLSVSDTGSGMSPDVQARIFEPFFTTKQPGEGTGLGLAIVFGIVKAHQGWVTVSSACGQGSEFRVYLPATEACVTEEPELAPELVRGGQECILVVDDEPFIRKLARTILEQWGFPILTAADGEEALAVYREHGSDIDLVLLDCTMPGMTGLEVLQELQKLNQDVRVVFSSGHSVSGVEQLLAAGGRAFVAKPYRPEELVGRIRQVLDEPATALNGTCVEVA